MPAMVDSCVLLDIFTRDARWYDWSASTLARIADEDGLVLNPIIYGEVSIRFDSIEKLESLLPSEVFDYRPIPREAAFLVGKCFMRYRKRGGRRSSPLPDFFIGAHAAVSDLPLVTRDTKRFRDYFPRLVLVCP